VSQEPPDDAEVQVVSGIVAGSRRYRSVDPAVVRRVASEELPRARNREDAVKRVKRRLHQAVGAYRAAGAAGAAGGLARDLDRLRTARERDPDARLGDELRAACRDLLARHASTRERLPFLDRFYAGVWDAVGGVPASLLDLGCGLAPLSLPWMGLEASAHYHAIDADIGAIGLVDAFLSIVGQAHAAEVRDLAAPIGPQAAQPADVALLLKLVPILDRQDPSAAQRLVQGLTVRHVVASFPVRSLGGHARGMEATYRRRVEALVSALGPRVRVQTEASVPNELVVVLTLG